MAINLTQLFGELGKLIKAVNNIRASALGTGGVDPNYPSLLDGIQTTYQANGRDDLLEGVIVDFQRWQLTLAGWAETLANRATQRILHPETILNQLPSTASESLDRILVEIFRYMKENAATVKKTVTTVNSVVANGTNNGNGTIFVVHILDGVNSPSPGFPANPKYRGLLSELCSPDTITLTCNRDEDFSGVARGSEEFVVEGTPAPQATFGGVATGSGVVTTLPTLQSYFLIANSGFESFLNNVPESWDVDAGTPGTHIIYEPASANVYAGTGALKLVNGVNSRISQTLLPGLLEPNRLFCISANVKTSGVTAGDIIVRFESPSGAYTATIIEQILINSAYPTSYQAYQCWVMMPATPPDDLELVIRYEGGNGSVWIDNLGIGPATYANGVALAAHSGSTQFVLGDRFTFSITAVEGVFQKFFREHFKFQLPSATSPTISDTLAQ